MAAVERDVTIPTRWVTQLRSQLEDGERRLAAALEQLARDDGGRALEDVYPGVMAAALVKVWLTDEPWHRQRSAEDLQSMVRAALPSGFATLFEMKLVHRSFAGWRAEDARPLLDEARDFIASVRADFERCSAPPSD